MGSETSGKTSGFMALVVEIFIDFVKLTKISEVSKAKKKQKLCIIILQLNTPQLTSRDGLASYTNKYISNMSSDSISFDCCISSDVRMVCA